MPQSSVAGIPRSYSCHVEQQLREGTSAFLTVFPILWLYPGHEGQGIKPGEKQ